MLAALSTLGPLVSAYGPLIVFMLIPLWIPLGAIVGGAIADRAGELRGQEAEPPPLERLRLRRAAERAEPARALAP
ncbi:MAG TPA: hypothetical protein VFE07_10995 [Marmoricola sp.]|nr:hypothetical protein [Marmoricola sp.]